MWWRRQRRRRVGDGNDVLPFLSPLPIHWLFSLRAHTHTYFISQTQLALFFFSLIPLIYDHLVPFFFLLHKDNCISVLLSLLSSSSSHEFTTPPSLSPPSAQFPYIHCALERVCVCVPCSCPGLIFGRRASINMSETKSRPPEWSWKNESMSISVFLALQKGGGIVIVFWVLSTNLWRWKRLGTTSPFYIFFFSTLCVVMCPTYFILVGC